MKVDAANAKSPRIEGAAIGVSTTRLRSSQRWCSSRRAAAPVSAAAKVSTVVTTVLQQWSARMVGHHLANMRVWRVGTVLAMGFQTMAT